MEPGRVTQVAQPLPHPPDDILGRRHARRDHRVRECLRDDRVHGLLDLAVPGHHLGKAQGDVIHREKGLSLDPIRVLRS